MLVRLIRWHVDRPGYRTRELTVMTTLLDADLYPTEEILRAYFKRWRLEMCFDDLKTTLGMEMLQCRSPEMVKRELVVFLITHNLIRWLMAQGAHSGGVDLERLSFTRDSRRLSPVVHCHNSSAWPRQRRPSERPLAEILGTYRRR